MKATLSTACRPTCTWKDGSQLHHHPSRHRPLGHHLPPMECQGKIPGNRWNSVIWFGPSLVTRFCVFDRRSDPSEGICAEHLIVRSAIEVRSFQSRSNVSVSHQSSRSKDPARRASSGSQLCFFARPKPVKIVQKWYCDMMVTPNSVLSRLFFNCALS